MEGNKDEALRCIRITEEAIASGNKDRALKFIKIAQRLNRNLPVDTLLSMCEHLDSQSSASSSDANYDAGSSVDKPAKGPARSVEGLDGEMNYTEENVKLIRELRGRVITMRFWAWRRFVRLNGKLSLKVHPDKNKVPSSEDAFKRVLKAFKCLSDDGSRRQYDLGGLVDEFKKLNLSFKTISISSRHWKYFSFL